MFKWLFAPDLEGILGSFTKIIQQLEAASRWYDDEDERLEVVIAEARAEQAEALNNSTKARIAAAKIKELIS